MKPLIKWPGGKEKVIKYIDEYLPKKFENYIEPFLGSGALYFYLEPKNFSFLNDINENLIYFYRFIQENNNKFASYLLEIAEIWDNLDKYLNIELQLLEIFNKFKDDILDTNSTYESINKVILTNFVNINSFYIIQINSQKFILELTNSIYNKFLRLKNKLYKILTLNSKISLQEELIEQLKTSKRAGFYYYMRFLMNNLQREANNELYIAIYIFVREYCFGSMFRFNKYGEFNIPYGGKAYNNKSFLKKIKYFFNPYVQDLLQKAKLYNLDFRKFFEKINISKNDFIFLDPPYLTRFRNYEGNLFTEKDHKDLVDILQNLNAKYLLILQYNKTVEKIYQKLNTHRTLIDGKYTYSARGRNNKNVTYILFYNYTPSKNLITKEFFFKEFKT